MSWANLKIDVSKITGTSGKTTCPRCSDARSKPNDPCLSVDLSRGLYNCHHCTWHGGINKMMHVLPNEIQFDLNEKVLAWFTVRGISKETLEKLNVKQTIFDDKGIINFNYYRENILINIKYRDGAKSFRLYKDAELIFYNLDAIKNTKEVIITEGEIDCLSFIEAGLNHCVSVPNGANKNLSYINNSWEYLENKEKIYICVDKDEAGKKLETELVRRFGKDKCYIIDLPKGMKDANECLTIAGKEELLWRYDEAKLLPLDDIQYIGGVKNLMLYQYEHGKEKGTTTYFKPLDPHFTWKKGQVTLFHGIGGAGKTKLVYFLLMLKSIHEGDKWGIFSPEQYPANEFYDDLVHIYLAKNIDIKFEDRCTLAEYEKALDFVGEHFFYIYPETKSPTPEFINAKFKELIITEGITGGVIDPYNQLDNDMNKFGRDDLYISNFLTQEKRFAQIHDFYKIIIAHPKTLQKNAKGGYDCPSIYNLHGGSMWVNKCDNIIAVHSPNWHENKADTLRLIDIQKIKMHLLVGLPGEIYADFNRETNRYEPTNRIPI